VKILVTGANGLVGQRLCRLLASHGVEVIAAGRGPARFECPGVTYVAIDLTLTEQVTALIAVHKPEVVVNPASMTDVDGCEKAPWEAYLANAAFPAQLAVLSKSMGFHLVHVSTDYVFDGLSGPYGVDDVPNPKGVYAQTKHLGEQAVQALGGSWAIARTAVVYGWPAAGRNNFGAWLVSSFTEKKGVKLFSDQFVSPSLALNVAAMLAELAERKLTGVWNTSGATVVDRVTFGKSLCEVFGFDASLITPTTLAGLNLAAPRPPRSGLKIEKTAAELAAKPLALADALQQFHAEYRGVSK
jgi:dTDP-4-dehydrorhamnose reductase